MQCLKRALKIADVCMANPKNLYLLVILLNKYLYFFSMDVEFVSGNHVISIVGFRRHQ